MHHYNIKPKEGLGDVKFLSTVDEFISMIGQPDDDELIHEKISKFNFKNTFFLIKSHIII